MVSASPMDREPRDKCHTVSERVGPDASDQRDLKDMIMQSRNKTATAVQSNGNWKNLPESDQDFVLRCLKVLAETRHDIDGMCRLLPRMSLEMTVDAQRRTHDRLSRSLMDYMLCIGYMISRIRETDPTEPDYCDRLRQYIGSHDWERIAQPLFSVLAAVTTSGSAMECDYLPARLINTVARFCLKLSIFAGFQRRRSGLFSRYQIDAIQMEATSLMGMQS